VKIRGNMGGTRSASPGHEIALASLSLKSVCRIVMIRKMDEQR